MESRDLFLRQFEGGTGARLPVERAEGALAETEAIIPELEARIVAKENELSVLLGRPVGEIPRGTSLSEQQQPPVVPAGIPATLLERRPDLVEAEQGLVAANARVGESIASFLPRIGLTSFLGRQSNELSEFLGGSSRAWSVAGAFSGPIFQGGRLWSLFEASKAERDAATQLYDQRVLVAMQEVSDALVAWDRLAVAREAQARAVKAYGEAVRLAFVRFWGGLATYFEVLEAQKLLFPAENRLAQIELARLRALVQLYKALGGGWSVDRLPGDETTPSPSAEAEVQPPNEPEVEL
jgi:multidrug efflux system outer membrane protein